MKKLSPSILSADFNILGSQIETIRQSGADYLHIDVMDGAFVKSISYGMPLIKSIRKNTDLFFDVHLMINEPIRYIREFAECGADLINVHYEACSDITSTLEEIRKTGVKAGLTIKPGTDVSVLKEFIDKVDLILLMSVEPGFGGQKFIESTYTRLALLKAMVSCLDNPPEIEVDGGINLLNAKKVLDAGADVIVAGSSIFKGDLKENLDAFMNICRSV
ncbi:MAG: ribulose-phosphate 3-epimerase [Clostridiales bacterium]|nr:ribulose-phosphate 3-epimerase [Clostridiales bacterium]